MAAVSFVDRWNVNLWKRRRWLSPPIVVYYCLLSSLLWSGVAFRDGYSPPFTPPQPTPSLSSLFSHSPFSLLFLPSPSLVSHHSACSISDRCERRRSHNRPTLAAFGRLSLFLSLSLSISVSVCVSLSALVCASALLFCWRSVSRSLLIRKRRLQLQRQILSRWLTPDKGNWGRAFRVGGVETKVTGKEERVAGHAWAPLQWPSALRGSESRQRTS